MKTNKTTHTPGPWSIYAGKGKYDERQIVSEDGYFVASTHPLTINGCEEANARLIAAAPELLVALRSFVDSDDADGCCLDAVDGRESDGSCDYCAARAAIAKAEGR